ncbi:VOC family protein [Actinocatenispora rupis]|uniref:Glyoxalase n=1 Tax=Actinocatenispora rupis TaxID=519421 RepID=A0A8J3N8X7_9ACTN|nr:VOC family protein [Actinocatenispora rupis]GID10774.1 glyoxalase [Actinocatenispora rupis]
MFPTIRHITIDCSGDPYDLGLFWSALLGRPLSDDDKPGDPEAVLDLPGGPGMLFVRVPEGRAAKNRVHLDLQPTDERGMNAEVERVQRLGGRILHDRRTPEGRGWVVFADPEGNEFCVERSAHEYATLGFDT